MPHIETGNDFPGIRGLMEYRPKVGAAMNRLAQALLVDECSLSRAERELIATHVSAKNGCTFCAGTHAAIAARLMNVEPEVVFEISLNPKTAPGISSKLKALFVIANTVRQSGSAVNQGLIDFAKATNPDITDEDIYYTIAIASAFSMFNRFVEGLGATIPDEDEFYEKVREQRAAEGYLTKSFLTE